MTEIKICGITNVEDALAASHYGADKLGFIFYKKSPRYLTPEKAREISKKIPSSVKKVGVFVNEDKDVVNQVLDQVELDILQFSGDETSSYCKSFNKPYIKAIRVKDKLSLDEIENFGSYLLFDSYSEKEYGGTGKAFDWNLIQDRHFKDKYVILSGGLNPENVRDAILKIKPHAVDVATGVEKHPGVKDHQKLKNFIKAVKNAG